jgi:porin
VEFLVHRTTRWRAWLVLAIGLVLCLRSSAGTPAEVEPVPEEFRTGEPISAEPEPPGPTQPWSLLSVDRLTGDWGGGRTAFEEAGFKIELSYQQQYQQSLRGGIGTGQRLSGTYDLVAELDFEQMHLIDGGSFYIKAKGGFSRGINHKVGALGDVNADVFEDYGIFVRKWWYRQLLFDQKIELRVGRLQTNKDLFDISLYANHEDRDFLNTHSIRNPTIPHANGIGAFLKVQPVDGLYFQTAAIDAQVVRRTRTGFDTGLHDEAWFVGLWELGFAPDWPTARGPMPGRYRVGWWYDPRVRDIFMNTLDSRRRQRQRGGDTGLYLGADQRIWKENSDPKDSQGLGVYARAGFADEDVKRINRYWSVGASYQGLIPTRDSDVAAFGVAQAILSPQYRRYVHETADRETVYEWNYQVQVTPWFTITPDLQVITNPGGDRHDRDAIVAGIRMRMIF